MAGSAGGLRELKKQMTRDAIATAAMRLAQTKGLDMTIEEIAAEAVISPRTFSNYFSCKEEALMNAGLTSYAVIVQRIGQTPRDHPLIPAIHEAISGHLRERSHEELDAIRLRAELVQQHPSLQPWYVGAYADFEARLRTAVAKWSRRKETDLYPQLVAQVVTATVRAATGQWIVGGSAPADLVPLIDAAFGSVEAGLTPVRTPRSRRAKEAPA